MTREPLSGSSLAVSIVLSGVLVFVAILVGSYLVPVDRDNLVNLLGHALIFGIWAVVAARISDKVAARIHRSQKVLEDPEALGDSDLQ